MPYDGIDQDCSGADLIDVDGDGYTATQAGGDDCDDQNQNTHPGATEYGDGRDNDCDGSIDEGLDPGDDDQDGWSEGEGDCDDTNPAVYPGAEETPYDGIDQDCSGTDLTDFDGDGYPGPEDTGTDCDDQDPEAYPGATEIPYDEIDQDCNGADLVDVDEDGFIAVEAADPDEESPDCDDQDPFAYPGAIETPYDGVDQDCDGTDLQDVDGDGYGDASSPTQACAAPDGYVDNQRDCDDSSADVKPGGEEVCNGRDDDCDTRIDDGVLSVFYVDGDSDGYGDPAGSIQACVVPDGYVTDTSDCDDSRADVYPGATEVCDGLDNDCDEGQPEGGVDEGVMETFYRDVDEDSYGDPNKSTEACSAPTGYVADDSDCNDLTAAIRPGATEVCNGADDNCDGQTDEGVLVTYYRDNDSDGYGTDASIALACSAPSGYVEADGGSAPTDCDDTNPAINPGAEEADNGVDDDCDGEIDEGFTGPIDVTFTNCGQTGKSGPSQSLCDNTYNSGNPLYGQVSVVEGLQYWTVPYTGTYRITAYGAQGGVQSPYSTSGGGLGAKVSGEFEFVGGTELKILVGQKGKDGSHYDVGGGGGTFVVLAADDTPLIVAGGGGSAGNCGQADMDAQAGQAATGDGNGGSSGNDGDWCGCGGDGSAGGGFYTDGGGGGGKAFVNGGQGTDSERPSQCVDAGWGGFGGGGNGGNGGPGGGGYQGGDAGGSGANGVAYGNGGKSYNAGANPNAQSGVNTDHGKVEIERL